LQWAVVLPLEITAAAITVQYWTTEVNVAIWITVFYIAIIAVNIFGTLGYAEEEFWSSCLKLLVTLMFILAGTSLSSESRTKAYLTCRYRLHLRRRSRRFSVRFLRWWTTLQRSGSARQRIQGCLLRLRYRRFLFRRN
jgi:amino acid permease